MSDAGSPPELAASAATRSHPSRSSPTRGGPWRRRTRASSVIPPSDKKNSAWLFAPRWTDLRTMVRTRGSAINRDPSDKISSACSSNSVEDLRAAFRAVAGLRLSRQLPQTSLSASSGIFWEAPCFSFRLGASGGGWHRFKCSFCNPSHGAAATLPGRSAKLWSRLSRCSASCFRPAPGSPAAGQTWVTPVSGRMTGYHHHTDRRANAHRMTSSG